MHDMTQEIDGQSNRFNSNKNSYSNLTPALLNRLFMYENIPYRALSMLAEHYTLAAMKYPNAKAGEHSFPNWAKGQLFESFVIDSMWRHLLAYNSGEKYDEDFGSHHLVSVAWGAAALFHFFSNYELYQKFDDRKWVGFNVPSGKGIQQLLLEIQTTTYVPFGISTSFELFFGALLEVEKELGDDVKISYKIDEKRLERIKNTNYGNAKTAASKGN